MRIGDTVLWRGCFGTDKPKTAKIVDLELCDLPRSKEGTPVDFVPWGMKDYAVVTLDNGHWAYGKQIFQIY